MKIALDLHGEGGESAKFKDRLKDRIPKPHADRKPCLMEKNEDYTWAMAEEDIDRWATDIDGNLVPVIHGNPISPPVMPDTFRAHEISMGRSSAWPGDAGLDSAHATESRKLSREPSPISKSITQKLDPIILENLLQGKVDVIGDIHGEREAVCELLGAMGWTIDINSDGLLTPTHPRGRALLLLGDIVARGPDSTGAINLVLGMERAGTGIALVGNHDWQQLALGEGASLEGINKKDRENVLLSLKGGSRSRENAILDSILSRPTEISWTAQNDISAKTIHAFHAAPGAAYNILSAQNYSIASGDLSNPKNKIKSPENLVDRIDERFIRLYGAMIEVAHYSEPAVGDHKKKAEERGGIMRIDWREANIFSGSHLALHGHHVMKTPRRRGYAIGLDGGLGFGGRCFAMRIDRYMAGLPDCIIGRSTGTIPFAA